MITFFKAAGNFLLITAPWWGLFIASFLLCLLFTPLVRELARKLGMVDIPSARRINKTPVPRGGGVAIFLSFSLAMVGYALATGARLSPLFPNETVFHMCILVSVLVVVGLVDDKFGLPPVVKLLGQVMVALGAFIWCDVSLGVVLKFEDWLPVWADGILTVLWIVGAINAFNLIDGLDGLATGLAVIAAIGMGGALFFIGYPQATLVYMAFVGACLGFLRYNFNPASVFLGDTGSMFLGFTLASLPLMMKSVDSLFVSVGVPVLAMGVPIFDTALAILRRTIRALLRREKGGVEEGNSHVMQADTDHLHHRLLKKYLSQKKAAGALYALAGFLVAVALGGLALRDRAAGLFVMAFVVAVAVAVHDMRRVELWDAGRLLNATAHDHTLTSPRRRLVAVPFYVTMDIFLLVFTFLFVHLACGIHISSYALHTALPLRVVPVFFCLVALRAYSTIWGRAQISNHLRLVAACFVGSVGGSAAIILLHYPHSHLIMTTVLFFALSTFALVGLRLVRPVMRDLFYHLDHSRLADNAGTSRVVVYGAGLRYGMFRRELVRSTSNNSRVIVGLLDDDVALRGLYVGGMRVHGGLEEAPAVIRELRADAVVIACVMSPERLEQARRVFADAGVKVSLWSCEERDL